MTAPNHRTPERASFYLRKCRDHLRRAFGSYHLALRGLESCDAEALERDWNLEAADGHTPAKMKEVLVRSHFLLLKVNFELFLQLIAIDAWRVALHERRRDVPLSPAGEKRLRQTSIDAATIMEHPDPIEAVCSTVVPRHGLDKLRVLLEEASIDVRSIWNRHDPAIWGQLNTAFAVRHVIEHRNGRIDASFRNDVKVTWGGSSWGKRSGVPLAERERVEVTPPNLMATQATMLAALEALEPKIRELDERHAVATAAS